MSDRTNAPAVVYDERRGVPSCSALGRLGHCPASFRLGKEAERLGLVPPAGPEAESGTRIHRWLETESDEDWAALSHDEKETAGRCYEQRKQVSLDWFPGSSGAETFHELRLGMTELGVVVPVFPETRGAFVVTGKADLIYLDKENRRALIIDDKTGRGEVESATGNKQLLGLAVLASVRWNLNEVRVAIVQPWAGPPSVADYGGDELTEADIWLDDLLQTINRGGSLVPCPGDWCQYCPARAVCPALRDAVTDLPEALTDARPAPGHELSVMTARALDLPAEQLANLLRGRRMIGWYVSAIEAAARIKLERGETVPGYDLRERQGRRKITDTPAAANAAAPLLVGAEGGSAAALLRCATLSAKQLQDEVQRASGKKTQTRYNMTTKDAKEALARALDGLMESKSSLVLTEVGGELTNGEEEGE